MPKTYPVRNSFNAGEVSELISGMRDDIQKYSSSCLTLENASPLVEGGAKKMPGTYFAGGTANGGAMFTGSISTTTLTVTAVNYGVLQVGQTIFGAQSGTTITALGTGTGGVGTYTVSPSQTFANGLLQTASSGKSRLVPFQFSTIQGAILEFSAGIVRVWEGSSQGVWSLGLVVGNPANYTYNPATAYTTGNVVSFGQTYAVVPTDGATPIVNKGVLYISAIVGVTTFYSARTSVTVNGSDALSVTIMGTAPSQYINIALANATASNNSAAAIQAAIRALGSMNSPNNNYIDLTTWTVTPDAFYYATPWIALPATATQWQCESTYLNSWLAECSNANQYDQFPIKASIVDGFFALPYNTAYWSSTNIPEGPPLELTTPYLEGDLFALDCSTQSADVLWVFHPNYPPAVIERVSANVWQYSLTLPGNQPGEPAYRGTTDVVTTGYSALGQNISLISQASACVVVLATGSAAQPFNNGDRIYINECAGMVELNEGEFLVADITLGTPAITVIDAAGNSTTVTPASAVWYLTLQDPNTGDNINSSGYLQYQGGGFAVEVVALFAAAGDYPSCGTLYQERLAVGGSDNNPTQMNGSVQGDYPDFICDPNEEDYAIQFTLVSNQVNQLLNMIGTPNALLIGTSGGVWVMSASNGESLSQTNVNASQQSSIGVSALQPQLVNGSAIFVSRSTRIVTFLVYSFTSNQWENNDLTRLNRNITLGSSAATSGIAQTAFQVEPYPIFWAVRNDGQLIGLVFNVQDQVYAWFRVNMTPEGGTIESVAVISGQGQEDQVVVVVNRTINGVTQRYVEYFMPQELFSQLSNAFFVHCGQQWHGLPAVAITGIANGVGATVTAPNHGFSNGMQVQISGVVGMASPNGDQSINQDATEAYTVASATTDTFELATMDTTTWTPYVSGGSVEQVTNQVTGMSYLMGQSVVATGDGALIIPTPTPVTSDTVTFPFYCNVITIGLPYQMTVQPTNPVLSGQGATTRSMPQKINRISLSLYQSMGGQYGDDLDHMYDITYGPGAQGKQPKMSTFDSLVRDTDCDWTEESTFFVTQNDPLPFTLRGIVFRMSANQD